MATESAMNAAGRTSSHPFSDFRSASLAHRRTKKYPRQKDTRRRNRCCEICNPPRHSGRLARNEEAKHHIQGKHWTDDWAAHREFEEELKWVDDIKRYELFGQGREVFEKISDSAEVKDGWMISGEDFGAWGRRRIAEMRAVKEERLREAFDNEKDGACNDATVTPRIPSLTSKTTLPTTASDIHAHSLLKQILTPTRHFLRLSRLNKGHPFPAIYSFAWFGEYDWQWHRNYSGCWELGYADACGGCSIPCSCCCVGNGSMYWPCHCADFGVEPAPDEMQRCSLVEWVYGELWRIMKEEALLVCDGSVEDNNEDCDDRQIEEWEVMSDGDAASEGWSVVGSGEEFELL